MEHDKDPFEEEDLIRAVEQFEWSDAEACKWGNAPSNAYYQFQPPAQYARYYHLLRVMLNSQQKSPRCFALTTLMLKIKLNNYYALMLRKDCLVQNPLNKAQVLSENCFINYLLEINSKQYQLWTYKKFLFEKFRPEEGDLQLFYSLQTSFLDELLESDSKNYHVWDYRLWLTFYFGKAEEQLDWSMHHLFEGQKLTDMMDKQLKDKGLSVCSINWANCYSLWSFRFNLAQQHFEHIPQKKAAHDREQLKRVKAWLEKEQNRGSECGWTYITGLAFMSQKIDKQMSFEVYDLAKSIYKDKPENRFAGNACLQMLQLLKERFTLDYAQEIKQLIHSLAANDPIREKYYNYLLIH